jgi:hypothetical protein
MNFTLTKENCANDVAMEIGTRDTASGDEHVKKDPADDVGQEGLSEPKPKEPENCAKLLNGFASICEKRVPEEPPENENKNGGIRTAA